MTSAVPAPARSSPGDAPAPLGEHPSYDEVLDAAVEYTFPASDPIAVESYCCDLAEKKGAGNQHDGDCGDSKQPTGRSRPAGSRG